MLRRDLPPARKRRIKRTLLSHGVRPTPTTVQLVGERDSWRCALDGEKVFGTRGWNWSLGHRRPAGMGGDPRPETHAPGNLVLLCGHGSVGCHSYVETHREWAYAHGLLIPKEAIFPPSSVMIQHAVHGACWLLDDGTISYEEPACESS